MSSAISFQSEPVSEQQTPSQSQVSNYQMQYPMSMSMQMPYHMPMQYPMQMQNPMQFPMQMQYPMQMQNPMQMQYAMQMQNPMQMPTTTMQNVVQMSNQSSTPMTIEMAIQIQEKMPPEMVMQIMMSYIQCNGFPIGNDPIVKSIHIPRIATKLNHYVIKTFIEGSKIGLVKRIDFAPSKHGDERIEKVDYQQCTIHLYEFPFMIHSETTNEMGQVITNTSPSPTSLEIIENLENAGQHKLMINAKEYWWVKNCHNPISETKMNIHQVVEFQNYEKARFDSYVADAEYYRKQDQDTIKQLLDTNKQLVDTNKQLLKSDADKEKRLKYLEEKERQSCSTFHGGNGGGKVVRRMNNDHYLAGWHGY